MIKITFTNGDVYLYEYILEKDKDSISVLCKFGNIKFYKLEEIKKIEKSVFDLTVNECVNMKLKNMYIYNKDFTINAIDKEGYYYSYSTEDYADITFIYKNIEKETE